MNYRSLSSSAAFKLFDRQYPIACTAFVEGRIPEEPLTIPEKPCPHPSDKKRNDEARLKAMDAMRKMGLAV